MSIRVPYTYKSYPMSPTATKYSQKKAAYKAGGTHILVFMLVMMVSIVAFAALPDFFGLSNNAKVFIGLGVGIWAGIDTNRMVNHWYDWKIKKALAQAIISNSSFTDDFLSMMNQT